MLLRAAIIYCLAVSTILFAGIALWQRIEIAAGRATVADLTEQAQRLQRDFEHAAVEASSARRKAEATQDSLQRQLTRSPPEADQSGLAEQLATLLRERDDARAQALALTRKADALRRDAERASAELSALKKALEEAQRASAEADEARRAAESELSDLKAKATAAVPQTIGKAPPEKPATGAPVVEAEATPPASAQPAPAPAAEPSTAPDTSQPAVGALQPAAAPVPAAPRPKTAPAPVVKPAPVKKAAKKRPNKTQSESGVGSFFPF